MRWRASDRRAVAALAASRHRQRARTTPSRTALLASALRWPWCNRKPASHLHGRCRVRPNGDFLSGQPQSAPDTHGLAPGALKTTPNHVFATPGRSAAHLDRRSGGLHQRTGRCRTDRVQEQGRGDRAHLRLPLPAPPLTQPRLGAYGCSGWRIGGQTASKQGA